MNEPIEGSACFLIFENDITENPAIDGSVWGQNAITELADHGLVHGLAQLKQLMRDLIGLNQMTTEFDKDGPDGTLAGSDSAGQADSEHQTPRRIPAALIVFFMSEAIVMGPTPPGTG